MFSRFTTAALLGLALLLLAPLQAQEFKGQIKIGHHKVKLEQGKMYEILIECKSDFKPVVDVPRKRLSIVPGKNPSSDRVFFLPDRSEDYDFWVFPPPVGFPKDTTFDYTLNFKAMAFADKAVLEEKSKWENNDPTYKPERDSHFKAYKVNLKAGQLYVIDLVKGDNNTDPYLYLEGPNGKIDARDDDSGGNLNARLLYVPAADGEYRIVATTLIRATGPFTVSVRAAKN